ncbi:hypothetical protein [Streptomyces sp. MMS24-I29]
MRAGADEYRTTTPTDQQTPEGLVDRIGEYLTSSGWTVRPDPGETT